MLERLITLSSLYFNQELFVGSPGELFLRLVAEALDEADFAIRARQNKSFALTVENTDDLLRLAHLSGISITPYAQGVVATEVLVSYPVTVTGSLTDYTASAPEILYMDALIGNDYFYTDYLDFRTGGRVIVTSTSLIYSMDTLMRHGRIERRTYPVSETIPFLMLELEEDVINVANVFVEYPDGRFVRFYRSRNLHENAVVENVVIYNTRHIYDVVYTSNKMHLLFGRKVVLEDPVSHTGYTFPAGSTLHIDAVVVDTATFNSFTPELEGKVETVKINSRINATPRVSLITQRGYTTRRKDLESLKRELLAAQSRNEFERLIASYFTKYRITQKDQTTIVEGAVLRNGRFSFLETDRYFMQSHLSLYDKNAVVRSIPITPVRIIVRASNIVNPSEISAFVTDYVQNLPVSGTWIVNELVGLIKERFNVVCIIEVYVGEQFARKLTEDIVIYDGVLDVESVEIKPVLI